MNKNIFVIEDNFAITQLLNEILEAEGYTLFASENDSLLSQIDNHHPGLIIFDERLKEKSGSEMISSLKANLNTKHIPLMLLSGVEDLDNLAKSCNADSYINKPFDLDYLLSMVDKFYNTSGYIQANK